MYVAGINATRNPGAIIVPYLGEVHPVNGCKNEQVADSYSNGSKMCQKSLGCVERLERSLENLIVQNSS